MILTPVNQRLRATLIEAMLTDIAARIAVVRGTRVILDADLARLYAVETRRLNEQVRRNARRFPSEFMFRLTAQELAALMSQFATSNGGRGGPRKLPLAFTEHGAIMAATILNSRRAIEVSVFVVRAFVGMRETMATQARMLRELDALESRLGRRLDGHDRAIEEILLTLRRLATAPESPRRRSIGFVRGDG